MEFYSKKVGYYLLFLLITFSPLYGKNNKDVSFWYAEPAKDWKSAIPIGNGRIGGMIFGGIVEDQILLNENSIWCGPPVPDNNQNGPELIKQMRRLLYERKYGEAERLCLASFIDKEISDVRSYQPFGTLFLNHENSRYGMFKNYRRSLDYAQAITTVQYEQNDVKYVREAFVSAPDQVLVMRITANQPNQISLRASFKRPFGESVKVSNNCLYISGQADDVKGEHPGVKFDGVIRFVTDGGNIENTGNSLKITNANSVILYAAIATDYNLKDPTKPLPGNRIQICENQISNAIRKKYDALKTDHVADYKTLFNRSSIEIGFSSDMKEKYPIDLRIDSVAKGYEDPKLLLVYYDYCRYVFISASRKGNLPMNLQGIWNPLMAAPWRSNYHININIQEAYWFAEQANLPDCHEPFFTFTENLVTNGKITAKKMLGVNRGFAAGHRTDVWFYTAMTNPNPRWSMYVIGGAWCAQHLMEHFRFTQDRIFLEKRAFPVIREAALFFVDWLVPDPVTGKLVSGPTASAENNFIAPDGSRCSISMGSTQDQEMIWNTFRDYLEACKVLNITNKETLEVQSAFNKLALPKIASDGRLMEWAEEYREYQPGHRHISHLWGMMPGNRISIEETPKLAEAVSNSLNYRLSHDYDAQGWSLGWVSCLMSRLKEGDRALKLINNQYFKKAYPNMFVDAHGQVQVGDMMGVPLAMIEFLIQSHTGVIELLPALPEKWKDGKVKGLCARGGFVFDFEWKDSKLISASVYSRVGGICNIRYRGENIKLLTESGKTYEVSL